MKWLSKFKRLWGKGKWLGGAGRLFQSRDSQAPASFFNPNFVSFFSVNKNPFCNVFLVYTSKCIGISLFGNFIYYH